MSISQFIAVVLLASVAIAIIVFCCYGLWLGIIRPIKQRVQFKATLQHLQISKTGLLQKIYNDLISHTEFQELKEFRFRVSYFDGPHDAGVRIASRIITFSSDWIIDYYKREYSDFYEYKPFCWTIGHELGHFHYNDERPVHISSRKRMLQIMREVRADNYGRILSGITPQEAYNSILKDLKSKKISLKTRLVVTHPSWQDRTQYLLNFPTYNSDLETQIKNDYRRRILVSLSSAAHASLLE